MIEVKMMKRLQLSLRKLVDERDRSMLSISKVGGASYPTVHKYVQKPTDVQMIDLQSLWNILAGMGLSPAEVEKMPLGQVFDVVEIDEEATKK